MKQPLFRRSALAAVIALCTVLAACKEEPPPVTQSVQPSAASSTASAAVAPQGQPQPVNTQASKYTPEALETLLAPVALYPDSVLAQVLASATNPQEVLDAGNWLVAHPNLKGKELTAAIAPLGFTPPTMSLMHFPTVMDMMCLKMEWTTELGSAFLADEPGVLAAVQRLRQQAMEVGNLKDSEQMKVARDEQNNQQIVTIAPANPDVVYVPQYDPTAVYSPPAAGPASAPVTTTTTVPATTTTTVVEHDDDDDEYDRGDMVVTGLLAFGAGMLVNEVFNDDDEGDYYYPRWGSGYPSGYAPYRYNPNYGNGFRPTNGYNRPVNYQRGSNNNIYINARGDDYFNKFERGPNNYLRQADSPITAARPQRSELATLEQRSLNNEAAGVRRDAAPKGTYAGANRQPKGEYAGAPRAVNEANREARATAPKGSYAGANRQPKNDNAKATRDARQANREANVAQRTPRQGDYAGDRVKRQQITPQTAGARDRGYAQPRATHSKNAAQTATRRAPVASASTSRSAFQGVHNTGRTERAASQRGRESMANRAHTGRNTQPRRSTR
ncbi:DUF3300 domain-containing protein [Aeromonas rivipollensis]|uniref:DUF3300 domain-containing protein n=1 Tax=Aeromonas rivipollensis TaxID=948519 RepID=UPI0027D9AEE2|nr:DUF3300 domain-containing protein [uncultured Aeromonas sp.]MDU1144073.1 DUF3300 domain-containing protein [Aeromonas hydrophila]